jgi:hypothetical protein
MQIPAGQAHVWPLTRDEEADDRAAKWVAGIKGKVTRDAKLPGNPVVEVNLGVNNKVTNDGLKELVGLKGIKRPSLFFDDQITDAGMTHLKGLTTIEELNLSNTGVGDEGLKELSELARLKKLSLAGAIRLTDAAPVASIDRVARRHPFPERPFPLPMSRRHGAVPALVWVGFPSSHTTLMSLRTTGRGVPLITAFRASCLA